MAHRLAWENKNGEIPQGLFVCHKCDVPSCVNPDHMFIGTNADNMRDMKIKGRAPRGSRSAHAKLNEDQVREILSSAESYKDVAKRYGIAEATVSHIRAGFSWKHVKVDQPKRISKQAKLTVDQILTIRKSNEGLKELAARYNVSPENISYIRRGITWRNVNG
jgi:transcriptional regulator with XRE-family HTH domain